MIDCLIKNGPFDAPRWAKIRKKDNLDKMHCLPQRLKSSLFKKNSKRVDPKNPAQNFYCTIFPCLAFCVMNGDDAIDSNELYKNVN